MPPDQINVMSLQTVIVYHNESINVKVKNTEEGISEQGNFCCSLAIFNIVCYNDM